ncbi:MAG TPA: hypothetical protein VFP32_01885, partial [Candidatus Saccharimonadales bacterium]|nr:hypothetical protein [Candidatus Saccharimonadales bacterium]
MNGTIQSENEREEHSLRRVLAPSTAEVVLYGLLSIVLMIIFNSSKLVDIIGSGQNSSPEELKAGFQTLGQGLNDSFSTAIGGRLGQIILWSFIGAICYIAIWLSKNILNSFENDIIVDHYLHPTSYSRFGFWSSSIAARAFLLAAVLITLAFIGFSIKVALPGFALLMGSAAFHFSLP